MRAAAATAGPLLFGGFPVDFPLDVAVVPSRRTRDPEEVSVGWQIDAYHFDLPVVAAPMDSVTSPETAVAFGRAGGLGVLDLEGLWTRYENPEPVLEEIAHLQAKEVSPENTRRLQEIYSVPIKAELIKARLAEIREANLTYLMLAQNLIRKDRAEALFRLGLTEEAADLLGMLSTAQLLKIASSNMLLCRFRVDDDLVWNLLTSHNVKKVENSTTTQLHASILMAGKYAESVAATAH